MLSNAKQNFGAQQYYSQHKSICQTQIPRFPTLLSYLKCFHIKPVFQLWLGFGELSQQLLSFFCWEHWWWNTQVNPCAVAIFLWNFGLPVSFTNYIVM